METSKGEINYEKLKAQGIVKLKDQDDFSLWIRIPCDNLEARHLYALADIVEEYGAGLILFSSRKIPILPHIKWDKIETVQKKIHALNLDFDRCGATLRNTDVCHHPQICPDALVNPLEFGQMVDQFWNDPITHKVKISISACPKQCAAPRALSDIGFIATNHKEHPAYDVYLGGKLGIDPNLGEMVVENITALQGIRLIKNYLDYIQANGKTGERSAHLIRRLGFKTVKEAITRDLTPLPEFKTKFCTILADAGKDRARGFSSTILPIRLTNGEATSAQVRKIADIAIKYAIGVIHLTIWGSPEIISYKSEMLQEIRDELQTVGLDIIDNGIENMQTCFGGYCANSRVDTQALLRQINHLVKELGINNRNIKIAASGCPNSCGLSAIASLGFVGLTEPEFLRDKCTGCGLCLKACPTHAIRLADKNQISIDPTLCSQCGKCVDHCVFDAIRPKNFGYGVMIGGNSGLHSKIGKIISGIISPDIALEVARKFLLLVKDAGDPVDTIFADMPVEKIRELLDVGFPP